MSSKNRSQPPPAKKLKQGTLFSFFSTKKAATPAPPKQQSVAKKVAVGTHLSIYWPDDDAWYPAVVTGHKEGGNHQQHGVEYQDDGTVEWLNLDNEKYRLEPAATAEPKKRRRVIVQDDDDDEEEMEWQEDGEDASVYAPPDQEEEEDEFLVDSDDEDETPTSKKRSRPSGKKASTIGTTKPHSSPVPPPTRLVSQSQTSSFAAFAATPTPPPHSVTPLSTSTTNTAKSQATNRTRPSSLDSPSVKRQLSPKHDHGVPAYATGAVNPRGSHVHNHLKFLRDPKDATGIRRGQPGYNPRTLKVDAVELERNHKVKMTAAVQQWWDMKAQYFDTVLLFKTGKFYEMFHMDADVGVEVCGFSYMKGHVAHAGFPEISYGSFASKLVQAGYKVARVEQTETPDQLQKRKQATPRGQKKPQVVNREVCSILTSGTRTFCYLEDSSVLAASDAMNESSSSSSPGPLLAIREVLLEGNQQEGDDEVKPVCEYGIAAIDAVHGTITLGQFADDVLRGRMHTLLVTLQPCEILLHPTATSPQLLSLLQQHQQQQTTMCRIEYVHEEEQFPLSTALDKHIRSQLQRPKSRVHPWEPSETLQELHRKKYYPQSSKTSSQSVARWPAVLKAAIEGSADLALAGLGAALYYLQRNLIADEIFSMGIVHAYVPPTTALTNESVSSQLPASDNEPGETAPWTFGDLQQRQDPVSQMAHDDAPTDMIIDHNHILPSCMTLDGTTLHNLEILYNNVDFQVRGSLWAQLVPHTRTPHGARLLRAWLVRPLFRPADIARRTDAVQELATGGATSLALHEARNSILCQMGDLERLLSRVHSMSGATRVLDEGDNDAESTTEAGVHPNERAVLYEGDTYTKRKLADFSKVLLGLRKASQIPDVFADLDLESSGLLQKVVRSPDRGGCFPEMQEQLDWFFDHFDIEAAKKGKFEPDRGIDPEFDEACDKIDRLKSELEAYKNDTCEMLRPRHVAMQSWKYINTQPESKDKFLIELPASVQVPDDFIVTGKRGKGAKQVNKYRTSFMTQLVQEYEHALDVMENSKDKCLRLIFANFDRQRALWGAAAQATALLDALGALAQVASKPGYSRAKILDCHQNQDPTIRVVQGRHPCVKTTALTQDFVPNDLSLGGSSTAATEAQSQTPARVLLLSGPNFGGKSTLLRQTCLIAILAQMGSYVPAEYCELTPVDCIYTRLGASDKILAGQSTFFVELAEAAAALRGATRRSLVIMDELGRGTSTFDGTAIAYATVKHLVERSRCLTLFATHYHSLLDEWKHEPHVRLGHMECVVEDEGDETEANITFLYTLGEGVCPKSFGVNVARLAGLPSEVLGKAKSFSESFESEMILAGQTTSTASSATPEGILQAIERGNFSDLLQLWKQLQV